LLSDRIVKRGRREPDVKEWKYTLDAYKAELRRGGFPRDVVDHQTYLKVQED
jgi:hypothetical protein